MAIQGSFAFFGVLRLRKYDTHKRVERQFFHVFDRIYRIYKDFCLFFHHVYPCKSCLIYVAYPQHAIRRTQHEQRTPCNGNFLQKSLILGGKFSIIPNKIE